MYMIEISEDKVCDLYENIEKSLKYMGKAMQYIDDIKSDSERSGNREYDEEEEERVNRRRGMRSKSRYNGY